MPVWAARVDNVAFGDCLNFSHFSLVGFTVLKQEAIARGEGIHARA